MWIDQQNQIPAIVSVMREGITSLRTNWLEPPARRTLDQPTTFPRWMRMVRMRNPSVMMIKLSRWENQGIAQLHSSGVDRQDVHAVARIVSIRPTD